jgi:hypothetical protein
MSLWLVEEPETSLHEDLEIKTAGLLREIALDAKGRQQILCTSHSQVIAENATTCYLLTFVGPDSRTGTEARPLSEDERAIALASAGVAGFVVPFLRHPLDAILLTEGGTDKLIIHKAWSLLYPDTSRVRIIAVSDLGGVGTGGVATMLKLLEESEQHLKLRSRGAPCVAIIDWEEKDGDLSRLDKAARVHGSSSAQRFDEKDANPQIDAAVKGIERFLPTAFLRKHEALLHSGGLMTVPATGKFRYTKADVDGTNFKDTVAKDFAASATPADCTFLAPTLARVAAVIVAART